MVDDGSRDRTKEVLRSLAAEHDNVECLILEQNSGKANAVREAMLSLKDNGDYQYVGYWDADLATPFDQVDLFLSQIDNQDFVLGSRLNRLGAKIERKWYRHILGRVFATLASLSLGIAVYDTQCGAKFIKRNLIESLFTERFISYWLFDVELLFRLKNLAEFDQGKLLEIPLFKWKDVAGSKLALKDFIKAPMELLKMVLHY
jgi:glycosyltransferase involved in cell wall biosynthesis